MDSFVYKSMGGSLPDRSGATSARASRGARRFVLAVGSCVLLALPGESQAGTAGEMSKEAGIGFGSAVASLVYAPLKIVYAAGGLVVGGLAWCFSGGDNQVAKVVLTPSILGDYVVSPKQLVGDERIEFFGRDPDYADPDEVAVATAPPAAGDSYERAW